ncbi:hypothetical protein [Curtobacterium sp. RRHDQ10]|uniref:hypothetical protein n=1 Tax=Curtobacterium phyllosphaerae TaxID=3413379 RepID=UPI003BF1FF3E
MLRASPVRFRVRRALRRRAVLGVVAATVVVLAVLGSAAAALAVRAPTDTAREALRASPDRLTSVTISAAGAPVRQDRTFRRIVASAFGDAPVRVAHSVDGRTSTWRVRPDIARLTAAELGDLEHGFGALADRARDAFAADGGITTTGSGATTATTLHGAAQAARETVPVPLTILAVAGAVALGMLGRLLVASRLVEDRLLRARGASGTWFVGSAAVESAIVAVPAAVLGAAAAQLALWPLLGPPTGPLEVVVPVVAVVVLAVGASTVGALSGVTRRLDLGSARTTVAVSGAVVVVLLVLAAIAVWRYRDPSSTPATRASDPLAVTAPAAALTALGVAAALALGPLLVGAATATARGRGVGRVLATRLAARDLRVLATPTTLLALAIAAGALTAGTTGTTGAFLTDSGRIVHGGAVRATIGGSVPLDGPDDLLPSSLRNGSSEARVTPVLRFAATTPTTDVTVIGTDAGSLGRVLGVDRATFDADAVDHSIARADPTGLALGRTTGRALDITLAIRTGSSAAAPDDSSFLGPVATDDTVGTSGLIVSATAWVADGRGDLAPLDSSTATVGLSSATTPTVSTTLPPGGPWRLVAVDLRTRSDVDVTDVSVGVTRIVVGSRAVALPGASWSVARYAFDGSAWADPDADARTSSGPIAVHASTLPASGAAAAGVRLMPGAGRTVPIAVSRTLAAAAGLHAGDAIALDGDWAGFRGRVATVVPVVPGTDGGAAVLADLSGLDIGMLAAAEQPPRTREIWAAGAGSRATLRSALGSGAAITAPTTTIERPFVDLGTDTLLLGVTGGLLFGVLALVAAMVTNGRDRGDEARGLRAAGVRPRTQGLVRAFGPAVVVVHGVVAGLVAGVATSAIVAATSARSSAPAAPTDLPARLVLDWPVLVVPVGVVLVVGGVVVVLTAVTVGRAARRAGSGVDR